MPDTLALLDAIPAEQVPAAIMRLSARMLSPAQLNDDLLSVDEAAKLLRAEGCVEPRGISPFCPRAPPVCHLLFLESHPAEGLDDEFVGRLEKGARELRNLCADFVCLREQLKC